MKVKEEREKVHLELNIQKTKIMASSPITLWLIVGETMKIVTDFIFWAPKSLQIVTEAMKLRCLFLERKAMTSLNSILKSRDVILPTNVHLVKAMVFLVVVHRCESWTIKKVQCQRIDAFEL